MNKVAFCTLGCKVNQYETEAMITLFKEKGYEIVDFGEFSDIYIINTCTVTGTGERKSRQMIRRARQSNPDAFVAVAGCYSQVAPDEVRSIDGVSLVIGTKDRSRIVELVEDCLKEKRSMVLVDDILKQKEYEELWISSYEDKTRAFVKIEEGCNEFCSYCIIPYARGPVRSRPLDHIQKEVRQLAANGYKEIVLTGIHIGSYGKDMENCGLIEAVKAVCEVGGIERVRLGSVEPRILSDAFVTELSTLPKVCNHFHISLQSGCDATLRRMNRKYTTDEYRNAVKRLRSAFDNPAITTDIITGFPGETDDDFNESFEFMKEISFSEVHVFPYSPRKGTRAAAMDGQVEKRLREKRAASMIAAGKELHRQYMESMVGGCYPVLFERRDKNGMYEGHMTNYVKVCVPSDRDISGQIISVQILTCNDSGLQGVIV